jgi:hypothetical protein
MKFGLDKLQLFRFFLPFSHFSLRNLIGLRGGRVPECLLGCLDQLQLALEKEDDKTIQSWRKIPHIPAYFWMDVLKSFES